MKLYHLDRRLTDAEVRRLAGDLSKIPAETKDCLEMRFMAIQDWDFYEGFMVAALDTYRHLDWPGEHKEYGLQRVQMAAAFVLHDAGHLFRGLQLSHPQDSLLEKLTFTGVFDGNGHTVWHLTVMGKNHLGLFGQLAYGAQVKDLGVVDVNITGSGSPYVGGLVGDNYGTVT